MSSSERCCFAELFALFHSEFNSSYCSLAKIVINDSRFMFPHHKQMKFGRDDIFIANNNYQVAFCQLALNPLNQTRQKAPW